MLVDIDNLIQTLNAQLRLSVGPDFVLDKCLIDYKIQIYQTHGSHLGLNRIDGESDAQVSVYHWFDEYYLFIEVKLMFDDIPNKKKQKPQKRITQCSISISVFRDISGKITQLFRAEWDDYLASCTSHPQPHWHFTADTSIANTFKEYAKELGEDGFLTQLDPKQQMSDLRMIHFAMNGQWAKENTHCHSMESSIDIRNWLGGVLESIRTELNYLKTFD